MAQIRNAAAEESGRKSPGRRFAPAGQTTQIIVGATPAQRFGDSRQGVGVIQHASSCAGSTTRRLARFPHAHSELPVVGARR